MAERKKDQAKIEPECYVPTDQEDAILQKQWAQRKAQPPTARLKVTEKGNLRQLGPDHPDSYVDYALYMRHWVRPITILWAIFYFSWLQRPRAVVKSTKVS